MAKFAISQMRADVNKLREVSPRPSRSLYARNKNKKGYKVSSLLPFASHFQTFITSGLPVVRYTIAKTSGVRRLKEDG